MLQLHEIYGWQMSALQAMRLLRRLGLVSRQDVRQMRSLLGREADVPPNLWPVCNLLYLAEVAPANRLPV